MINSRFANVKKYELWRDLMHQALSNNYHQGRLYQKRWKPQIQQSSWRF